MVTASFLKWVAETG